MKLLLVLSAVAAGSPILLRDSCSAGGVQCSGNVLQQCFNGSWITWQDCGTSLECTTSGCVVSAPKSSVTATATTKQTTPTSTSTSTTKTTTTAKPLTATSSSVAGKSTSTSTTSTSTSSSTTTSTTTSTGTTTSTTSTTRTATGTGAATTTTSTGPLPTLTANSAASILPFASSSLLGGYIEGASVTCDGNFVAVGLNSALRLDSGQVLVSGGQGQFASSRFTGKNTLLVGDASTPHTVYSESLLNPPASVGTTAAPALFPVNPAMLQPNDFTLDKTFTRMYLSGMRYTSTSTAGVDGELWYFNLQTKALVQVPSSVLAAANIHRTNGIELSPDNQSLYVTSAQNGPPTAAKIFKFAINPTTGLPENPVVLVDIFAELTKLGINWNGMDPDGMKTDVNGVIHLALNGGQRVFRYNPATKSVQIINLATVQSPSNLQFGGVDGKRLVVVGHSCGGVWDNSCADYIDLDAAGREITDLRSSGNC